MSGMSQPSELMPLPSPASGSPVDLRFRTLLGEDAWSRLAPQVRSRFSKRLAPGEVALYRGRVVATEISPLGWLLAQAARCIGAPLPTMRGAVGPAVVAVTEDATGGQRWLRLYERPGRRPQMIVSTKRFSGVTGLEEDIGAGIAIALRLTVEAGGLVFRAHAYALSLAGVRLTLPRALSPGDLVITHAPQPDGSFAFRLTLDHPLFGRLFHQLAFFDDV
jgi:hypothetical protein